MADSLDQRPDRSEAWSRPWLAPLVVCSVHAICNVLAYVLLKNGGPEPSLLACGSIGIIVVQPVLLACWAVLGPGAFLLRLPWTIAALLAAMVSCAWGSRIAGVEEPDILFQVTLVGGWMFLAALVVAAGLRWYSRNSIQRPAEMTSAGETRLQFDLKYLPGLTTAFAVLFALAGRFAWLPAGPAPGMAESLLNTAINGGIVVLICLPTLTIPWAVLSQLPRWPLMGLGFVFWLVWTILLMFAFSLVFQIRSREYVDVAAALLAGQVGALIVGFLSAHILRWGGYRLVRREKRITPLPPGVMFPVISPADISKHAPH